MRADQRQIFVLLGLLILIFLIIILFPSNDTTYNNAIKKSNPAFCRNIIFNDNLEDLCLSKVANETRNPALCNDVSNIKIKDMCFYHVSLGSGEALICDNISDNSTKYPRDICRFKVAEEFHNHSVCGLINYSNLRSDCYFSIAVKLNNYSICEFVNEENMINCYDETINYSTLNYKDIDQCEGIDKGILKDLCLLDVAPTIKYTKALEACQDIIDNNVEQLCIKEVKLKKAGRYSYFPNLKEILIKENEDKMSYSPYWDCNKYSNYHRLKIGCYNVTSPGMPLNLTIASIDEDGKLTLNWSKPLNITCADVDEYEIQEDTSKTFQNPEIYLSSLTYRKFFTESKELPLFYRLRARDFYGQCSGWTEPIFVDFMKLN